MDTGVLCPDCLFSMEIPFSAAKSVVYLQLTASFYPGTWPWLLRDTSGNSSSLRARHIQIWLKWEYKCSSPLASIQNNSESPFSPRAPWRIVRDLSYHGLALHLLPCLNLLHSLFFFFFYQCSQIYFPTNKPPAHNSLFQRTWPKAVDIRSSPRKQALKINLGARLLAPRTQSLMGTQAVTSILWVC